MPPYASARYPKPTNWDEFEDICLSSFKTRWRSSNLQRHGRQGQAQQGVDIFSSDNFLAPVGIQCKNTVLGISTAIVDTEIIEAENFSTPLKACISRLPPTETPRCKPTCGTSHRIGHELASSQLTLCFGTTLSTICRQTRWKLPSITSSSFNPHLSPQWLDRHLMTAMCNH